LHSVHASVILVLILKLHSKKLTPQNIGALVHFSIVIPPCQDFYTLNNSFNTNF
jgi:hypothetical protein